MWPFKKQSTINVYCNFPRFTSSDDRDFLYRELMQDLLDEYGKCYHIVLHIDRPDNVVLEDFNEGIVKERAIRINIFRKINKCK